VGVLFLPFSFFVKGVVWWCVVVSWNEVTFGNDAMGGCEEGDFMWGENIIIIGGKYECKIILNKVFNGGFM
jgi:hypothetical protein